MIRDIKAFEAHQVACRGRVFAWGQHDCFTYVAGAVLAQGGPDLMAGLDPWTDEASALAVANANGGLDAIVSGHLQPIAPALAQRGDVVAIEVGGPFGLSLALVEGHTIAGLGESRARHLPLSLAVKAWRAVAA